VSTAEHRLGTVRRASRQSLTPVRQDRGGGPQETTGARETLLAETATLPFPLPSPPHPSPDPTLSSLLFWGIPALPRTSRCWWKILVPSAWHSDAHSPLGAISREPRHPAGLSAAPL